MLDELKAIRDRGHLWTELSDQDLGLLAAELELVQCLAGETLLRPGEPVERLLLVLQGRLAVESDGDDSAPRSREERWPGDLVGAIAFAAGDAQRKLVRCLDSCRLAALSRVAFDRLLESSPATWHALEKMVLSRVRLHHVEAHLDRLFGPFGALLPHVLQELEDELQWRTLGCGETLFRQGDAADAAYILLTGRLIAVNEAGDGKEEYLNTVLAGETVGEVGLLAEQPRSATVFAARDCELVRLSRRSFELMLERNSRALAKISRIIAHRLARKRYESDPKRSPIRCIALIPASEAVPVDELARVMEAGLAEHGDVLILSSDTVDRELGRPGIAQVSDSDPAHLRLLEWLHGQEAEGRFLIYQADPSWTAWTERCARQADRVTVVADATAGPDLGELETRMDRPRLSWSLALLHPEETDRPRGSARWLEGSRAEAIYHMRQGHPADQARLVRLLSGRAVGLVLGGGGARGFAQVGVMRAMEELGIPIDMVGGSSIGAILAFYAARGMSADDIQAHLRRYWGSLTDYTFPMVSLMAGRRMTNQGRADCAAWDFEDLWLPCFSVATNLTTSRSVVHTRGSTFTAIRASVAIPGVFPPVPSDGELLVDGGVLNNLPIDVMRELNPYGKVIGIDVVSPRGPEAKSDYGMSLSGWSLLARKILPFTRSPRVPGFASTMLTTTVVGASRARQEMVSAGLADLYHNIHVRGVGMLQFDAVDKSVEIGYRDSIERLREWSLSGMAPQQNG